jgi:hypothetical protein
MVSGIMQMALRIVENWCNGVGLSVKPDKNGLVAFTRKRKLEGFFELRFFGRKLQRSGSVKYLGLILDSRLTWREHVDVRVRKAQNSFWACRRVCGGTCGLGPKVCHWLYTSVIRPSVTFASLVCWPGCQTARAKARLSKIQRLARLGITGAVRTTPTCAMEALICLHSLELMVQCEARLAAHHLWCLGCWSFLLLDRGHSNILKRLQHSDPVFNMTVTVMRPVFNLEPKYRVTMLTREDWTTVLGASPEVKGLVWYTDGSKMKRWTGAGVYGQ